MLFWEMKNYDEETLKKYKRSESREGNRIGDNVLDEEVRIRNRIGLTSAKDGILSSIGS